MLESRRIFQYKNFYLFLFTVWLGLCSIALIRSYLESVLQAEVFNWQGIINWPIAYFLSGWIVSFIVVLLYFLSRNYSRSKFILAHLPASVMVGLFHYILTCINIILLERLFKLPETFDFYSLMGHLKLHVASSIEGIGIYFVLLLLLLVVDFRNRLRQQSMISSQLENELVTSQLQALKLQLNPHFLFNAMNTIAMMVRREKNREAVNMLSGLGDMMRNALSKDKKQFVTVEEEFDLINTYLKIESKRFQDRLSVTIEVDEQVKHYKIPNLILQPIVENAFKHGISNNINKAILKIMAKESENQLTLSVFNTGSALPTDWDLNNSKGIGIVNTTHRLRQLYQGNFKFLVKEENGGILFKIILPLEIKHQ